MALTPAGRRLVRDSEPLWARFQQVLLDCSDIAEASGIVRIGAGEIIAASCLPAFVASLEKELPHASLEVEIALTADLIQQILGGRMDLVFAAGHIAHPALKTSPIGKVDLLWLASPETVAAIGKSEQAGEFPIWSLSSHSPLYQIMRDAIAQSNIAFHTVNLCNNVRSLIDIVISGGGIGIFPHSMARQRIAEGMLVPIPGAQSIPPVEFQTVMRAGEQDPLILAIFERASLLDISASTQGGI